ncbi:oxaloacetate decarboxylase [Acidisphaera sp. L21]|jgi:carboxyvinyl-carboxyphosphonate phosphorylmutase|uniref:isocitrate lyase/PEP mutase family protein n=1 Tax=Acidisphaera sp. L21 TaxID=1641851 RepID=UPI001C207DF0|nr:isocitrate lyase/phosphoenolpyruvate mutase family protein [Acidisphaera sp. L21]
MSANTAHRMRLRFRDILAGDVCIHPGSVHDAISARIAGSLGFELAMFAGSVASLAVLGAPDIVVLTLTEFAEQARRICRAAPLPVLVDADHGYGNALNVMRTVQELETAGIAALTIEDTDLPTPFATPKPTLLSIEEGAGKIAAALAARDDPALAIVARTSAVAISGMDDAIARARAYAALGPDALFFTGITETSQLQALAAATTLPIILGSAPPALGDKAKLAASRVRISLQGHQPFAASVQAIHATLKALRDGTAPSAIGGVAPAALMREVTGGADYEAWTRRFLGG